MSTTSRSLVLGLALLAAGIVIYRYSAGFGDDREPQLNLNPVYTATALQARTYNEHGQLEYQLSADESSYYIRHRLFHFVRPVLNEYRFRDNGRVEVWSISADEGSVIINDKAHLKGRVVLRPLFDHPQLSEAATGSLDYDFNTKLFSTPDEVKLTGPSWSDTGSNFQADFNDSQITFKGGANVIYYPSATSR
ncbi:MAG: LPS export ABC transporter periplasmic protein LptC [Succinivibrio sp.]|nr:LPS export ABC transporter periplasmic protein LptC [Succinivibrio sp.]